MPDLKLNPTIQDFHNYVKELEEERGFSDQNVIEKCLLLGEEVGELFKAVRKNENLVIDNKSEFGKVSDELADIFIYVLAIANRYNINIEDAFRKKEEINKTRVWNKSRVEI